MDQDFLNWYEANEKKFVHGQMTDREIAYGAWLYGKTLRYQLCPKCLGQGIVSKPPWVPGDVHEWTSSACTFVCDLCNGQKVV